MEAFITIMATFLITALVCCSIILLVLTIYFLPTIIAIKRNHSNIIPLALLNTVFGWSGIAWFVCFIWSWLK